MKIEMRTTKNRKVVWSGEYSSSGKSLRCHVKGGAVVFVDKETGESTQGVNSRSRNAVAGVAPGTLLFSDGEYIPKDELEKTKSEV